MRAARLLAFLAVALAGCATDRNLDYDFAILRVESTDGYEIAADLVGEVGPRFAGSGGDRRAVQWAVNKLTALGFQNVRTEPVTVPKWERGVTLVEMRAPQQHRFEAVTLGGSVATPSEGVDAEVLGVPTLEALERLPDAAVGGKIVYFSNRMERTADGSGYDKAVAVRRRGAAVAGRKGARAVLIRSIGTGRHAHTGTTKYETGPKIAAAALSAPDADRLEHALATGPVRMRMIISTSEGTAQSANVIAEIPGQTPEIVLLGAHLDSWDLSPGANDDAAGVGIVIAAAARLMKLGATPYRTLRVVLFANEEYGAHGSKAYARAHAGELAQHVLAMEADSGSGPVVRLDAGMAAEDWEFVTGLAAMVGVAPGVNGKSGGVDVSALRALGVPELIASQDTTHYFDVHHTAADTIQALSKPGMVQATGIYAMLAHAALERRAPYGRLPVAVREKKPVRRK